MSAQRRWWSALAWLSVLAAGFVALGLPLSAQPRWELVAVVLAAVTLAGVAMAVRRDRRAPADGPLDAQLAATRELPVILVAGPYAQALFPRGAQATSVRRGEHAVWLLADTPERLAQTMSAVKAAHGRFPQAVLLPVIPEGNSDEAVLRREFTQWRRSLQDACQHPACVLRCYLAVYASLGQRAPWEAAEAVWFGDVIDISATMPSADNLRQRVQSIRRQFEGATSSPVPRWSARRNALGQALLDWMDEAALLATLAPLGSTPPLALHGLLMADVPQTPVRPGAWTRWLIGKTGLRPRVSAPSSAPLPLPEIGPLQVAGAGTPFPMRSAKRSVLLNLCAATGVTAILMGVSGWNNHHLVVRVGSDLVRYWKIPDDQVLAKRDALQGLQRDRAELWRYAQLGTPLGLGWGLYPGASLQSALDAAIASYRPPPAVFTLDSLSLFDSGKTALKAGASQQLSAVLRLILSNPNRRILIAGHTDNVGLPEANLKLSEARARAIRDWFVSNSTLPVTRFAIQGYGDTRPVASNQDTGGRARNRRVEITLISEPEAR